MSRSMRAEGGRRGHLDGPVQNTHYNPNFRQVGERAQTFVGQNSRVFVRDYNPTQFAPTFLVRVDL